MRQNEIPIGGYEADRLGVRMGELGLTQQQLAEQAEIDLSRLSKILSLKKTENVTKEKFDKILEVLGVGIEYVFEELPDAYNESNYLEKQYGLFEKAVNKICPDCLDKLANVGKTLIHVHKFAYTTIIDKISAEYPFVNSFFNGGVVFSTIPQTGYWKRFHTTPEKLHDCYVKFVIKPKKENSVFKISYTLGYITEKLPFNIPTSIRITYGEIKQEKNRCTVIQYYNNPSKYQVNKLEQIEVFTWIDKAEHYFVINCDNDFDLEYDLKTKYNKNQVSEYFVGLNCVIFQRHPQFHRDKVGDTPSDEVRFFWTNDEFLDFNPEIKNKI